MKQLVINKLGDPRFLQRAQGGSGGYGLDGKRSRAWCEYGYKAELTHDDYYALWSRMPIAGGAVGVLLDKCWETNPIVESKRFEQLAKDTFLWQVMRTADEFRLASVGWSAIWLSIAGEDGDKPATRGAAKALTGLTPIWSNSIQPTVNGEGVVEKYTVSLANGTTKDVHPSRIVIIGCPNDKPFLRASFNSGVDLEKILGGSGESYLKNAARQLNIDYTPEGDMDELVKISGQSEDTVRLAMNEVVREMNRGNDSALITQGADVKMLTASVSDPTGNFNTACASFAAGVRMPMRTIVGNQTGERASTEDNKALNQRAQARRINELSRDCSKLMRALYETGVMNEVVQFEWDDLTSEPMSERIASYSTLVTAMASASALLTPEQDEVARKIAGINLDG